MATTLSTAAGFNKEQSMLSKSVDATNSAYEDKMNPTGGALTTETLAAAHMTCSDSVFILPNSSNTSKAKNFKFKRIDFSKK